MARTPGSGWGGGPMLYQICPKCGKKKCFFDPIHGAEWHKPFRCISKECHPTRERYDSDSLIRKTHKP